MLRDATLKDADSIAAIWNPQIRDTSVTFNSVEKSVEGLRADIAAKADSGHAFLVAEQAERVIGFALYGQFRAGVGYAHSMEHTVYLSPAQQGQGVGRVLMRALEARAAAAGVHSMLGGISAENVGGIAFHTAIGYAEVARIPQVGRKFGRWMDLVLMQKML
ncbi:N-acetyltransferase family protein [Thalassovita sp.]|uniref:GNAT family N-acetyltransferase n=1 Tax=Thalassovita sp. TaxID=1979401 RepID=UPI0039B6EE44